MKSEIKPSMRLFVGLLLGIGIAAVDNFAFSGEVSPIVIVALLITAAAILGALWGTRGALAVLALWACLPLSHLVKHVVGLPDTMHPNTYASLFKLAGFSFVVTAIGAGSGAAIHTVFCNQEKERHESSKMD